MTDGISYSPFRRTTNTLTARIINRNLSGTTNELLTLQRQLASGRAINVPSEDPFGSTFAIQLQALLEEKEQFRGNLEFGVGFLASSDSMLGEINNLVIDARELGLGEIGTTASQQTQENAATVVNSILQEIVSLANSKFRGRYLFGGTSTTTASFEQVGNYVKFNGNLDELHSRSERSAEVAYSINAQDAFGSFSAEVVSQADLNPLIMSETLLSDLHAGEGINNPDSIVISDGTNTTTIDLSSCVTAQDVLDAAAAVLPATTTMTLAPVGSCFHIESTLGGADLTVTNYAGTTTAADLGILQTTGAGASFDGDDVNPRLTLLTSLSALHDGAGIDMTGFTIDNGTFSATVSMASATTVGDLINLINQSGTHVEARINEHGTAIDVASRMCGGTLTIGENSGTTADELGLRTMCGNVALSLLNLGEGVGTIDGDDFTIHFRDGTDLAVDVSGLSVVSDIINVINTHAANGGRVTASLAAQGNGIVLVDNTVDAGEQFRVTAVGDSTAASDLGIAMTCAVGVDTLDGDDVSGMRSESIFTTLALLGQALLDHNDSAISEAVSQLDSDLDRVLNARAVVGSRVNRLDTLIRRIDDEELEVKSMLSETVDLDFAEAMVRYSTLQAILEASLMTAGTLVRMSLLDFIS